MTKPILMFILVGILTLYGTIEGSSNTVQMVSSSSISIKDNYPSSDKLEMEYLQTIVGQLVVASDKAQIVGTPQTLTVLDSTPEYMKIVSICGDERLPKGECHVTLCPRGKRFVILGVKYVPQGFNF